MPRNAQPDADDLFADTRMSFGDHIEDLRNHLWRAIIGFGVAMLVSFFFASYVLEFIKKPVESALKEFREKRDIRIGEKLESKTDPELEKANEPKIVAFDVRPADLARLMVNLLEKPPQAGAGDPDKDAVAAAKNLAVFLAKQFPPAAQGQPDDNWAQIDLRIQPVRFVLAQQQADRLANESNKLNTFRIQEGMMVWLEVSMICGVILGSPWIFYQLWSFVAAGLYSNEKRLVHYYMPFSLTLFLCGVFLCELVVLPQAVRFLLEFNEWLGVNAELRLEDWLSFALLLPLVFGLSFQTPLVMLFLAKVGIFDADSFRAKRRIAWFLLALAAALVMPTTDIYTILMMQLPLIGLYEFGILLAVWVGRQQAQQEESYDPDEMVGV